VALIDAFDAEKLDAMAARFCSHVREEPLGTKGRWIWTGKVIQVRYCLAEDLSAALLDHATSGFTLLSAGSTETSPFVLFELWRVVWQIGDSSLLVRAARHTDETEGALWESRVYADFVLRGLLPGGPPPVKDLGAALVLPPAEAVEVVASRARRSVESARTAADTGRAVAALGPFGWARGVAWARRSLDSVHIVPHGLDYLFYGLPGSLP
jgi:hypothetical protein